MKNCNSPVKTSDSANQPAVAASAGRMKYCRWRKMNVATGTNAQAVKMMRPAPYGAGRIIFTACAFVPVATFIFLQRQYFILPADAATAGWFALSLVLTGLLQFFISYTIALLAFWVLEVS